jgi:hypothetical protein
MNRGAERPGSRSVQRGGAIPCIEVINVRSLLALGLQNELHVRLAQGFRAVDVLPQAWRSGGRCRLTVGVGRNETGRGTRPERAAARGSIPHDKPAVTSFS